MAQDLNDWKIWFPRAFWMNWADPKTWQDHIYDPTIWLPIAYLPSEQKERMGDIMSRGGDIVSAAGPVYMGPRYENMGRRYRKGDSYENIQNSNIINRSAYSDSLDKIKREYGDDVGNAFEELEVLVKKSADPVAIALLNAFSEELNKPQADKAVLKIIRSGIEKVLLSVAAVTETSTKMDALFAKK
jgi:hypothetical protein